MNNFINKDHGERSEEQRIIMEQISQDQGCPFCIDFGEKPSHIYHKKPLLECGEYWAITTSQYPYDGAIEHFLIVSRAHLEHISELHPNAWTELGRFASMLTKSGMSEGGTFLLRFGDTNKTGASVAHLHAQLVMGGSKDEGGEKMLTQIGYKKSAS